MPRALPLRAALSLVLAAACASRPAPPEPSAAPSRAPALVVVVVIDQLASWALEHYLPALDPAGALRRGIERGAFHRRVVYPFAGTYTAAGHTSIFTGTAPSEHGVFANQRWDAAAGRDRRILDDRTHEVFGVADLYASPTAIRVDTLADALERATDGRARIVAVSHKDRAVIPGAGRTADLALWYEIARPGFTTSRYYAAAPPDWLAAWERKHPLEHVLAPWTPGDAALLAQLADADDAPGEGDWHGLGTVFPHEPARSSAPYTTLRATPAATEHLLALAEEAAAEAGLGTDAVPDLLVVSVSTLDYAAHAFGPHSWEYVDNLIRADVALGAFLARLEARGEVAVLITSDHGGPPLPERTPGSGGRYDPDELVRALDAAVAAELGPGPWIAAYAPPYVYCSEAARQSEHRARVVELALARLARMPGVGAAFEAREAAGWTEADDPVRRAAALSSDPSLAGDIFVVPALGWMVDESPRGAGTSHGSPWPYDVEVPVVFWGPGVTRVDSAEPIDQRHVAATIAALLGVAPPPTARAGALPGSPAR
ncbi:MAG TPA: alkaline phosphatase family protein [Kofleriaceae bacterium]|nr:alkaline phosphatase family protein [Kofleriaceae bacterium]